MSRISQVSIFCIMSLIPLNSCTRRINFPINERVIQRIDDTLVDMTESGEFSGSVLVASEDDILLSKGYGIADVDNRIPNRSSTRFRIHWITMPFTALGILMLQEQGHLEVDDRICEYFPECPYYWDAVTIHHLLTHTSGLSDWIEPWGSVEQKPTSSRELVEHIKSKPPYFTPGTDFRYSDNGYIVLGYIIEQVSGQTYEDYLASKIFDPCKMQNTGYDHGTAGLAVGYKPIGVKAPVADLTYKFSAGGLYSTVEDLYHWNQALHGGKLIPSKALDVMLTGYVRTPSMDIENADYGYGWFIGKILNRRVIAHGGVISGYTSFLMYFPNEEITIIVLRNYGLDIYDRLEITLAEMILD